MTEAYPAVNYAVGYGPEHGHGHAYVDPSQQVDDLDFKHGDKKTRIANGGGSPSPGQLNQGFAGIYNPQQQGQQGQQQPGQLNGNNMAAMAAMLGQMQLQNGGMANGAGFGMMGQNGMMGINTGLAAGSFSPQISPFLGSPNIAQFSANSQLSSGQATFPSPMLNTFPSPNSANFATFPSPALSQGSFSGLPSGQGSAFGNGSLQMQQMMGLGLQGGLQNGVSQVNAGGNGQTGRTVYVGSLPADASVDELLSQVRFGPIDNVKVLPEKNCAFISFLDPTTAAAFHSDALMRKIQLHGQELKIGWGKPSAVPANVVMAVQQNGATRNVYLGNLDENITEQALRDDLSRFGPIDQVKVVRDKNIGFVHFLSIATAMKVVQTLSTEPEWAGRRVNYGKDRCAYVPKNQHQQQQHNMAAAAMAATAAGYVGFSNSLGGGMGLDPSQIQPGNRTVYLGNIHPETTLEEICNTIRGGILQQIRYIQDKHIAFVTFVDSNAALAFFHMATYQGIALHNRRLKIGWGKHSGPPSPGIAMVVQAGGSRNVYIGQIDDFDVYDETKIRADFSQYGEIELVNLLKEKNCAFVNFTNIANSIKAIEGMKQHEEYGKFKIAYGKDRCANPPRNSPWSQLFSPNMNGPHSASPHATGFTTSPSMMMPGDISPHYSAGGYSPNPQVEEFAEAQAQHGQVVGQGLGLVHANGHASPSASSEVKQEVKAEA